MTRDEIVRDYRLSKTPMKQIKVLAELNGCSTREIVDVLREAGEEIPKQYQRKPESKEPEKEAEIPLGRVMDAAEVQKEIDDLSDRIGYIMAKIRGVDELHEKIGALTLENRALESKINEVIRILHENMEAAELRDIIVSMCASIYGRGPAD